MTGIKEFAPLSLTLKNASLSKFESQAITSSCYLGNIKIFFLNDFMSTGYIVLRT